MESAYSSSRFKTLEKSIDDHIIEQENKNNRAKTTRDVKLLIEFLRGKQDQRNPEDFEGKKTQRISPLVHPECEVKRRRRL